MESATLDLRDRDALRATLRGMPPEIVIHMAAQPLVRRGVREPHETFETNVMGLVNLLDALRESRAPIAFVCVTSDKVYARSGDDRAFVEGDALGGDDPYSASKACAEIVCQAYRQTYGAGDGLRIATARAGNVIGGGDYSQDRLVPDVVAACSRKEAPLLRNPDAIRPWQHVLDALFGYLLLAQRLHENRDAETSWNFGPQEARTPTVAAVAERIATILDGPHWQKATDDGPRERHALRVDSSKARATLGWRSKMSVDAAIDWTAQWYARHAAGRDTRSLVAEQISAYEALP